jgi:hypothetical protein
MYRTPAVAEKHRSEKHSNATAAVGEAWKDHLYDVLRAAKEGESHEEATEEVS